MESTAPWQLVQPMPFWMWMRVVEVDVGRQLVQPGPDERHVAGQAVAHRRQHLRPGPDLGMAGHAGPGRRDAGGLEIFGLRVAIAAIEPEFARVVLVAERHGLLAGDADACDVVSTTRRPRPRRAATASPPTQSSSARRKTASAPGLKSWRGACPSGVAWSLRRSVRHRRQARVPRRSARTASSTVPPIASTVTIPASRNTFMTASE